MTATKKSSRIFSRELRIFGLLLIPSIGINIYAHLHEQENWTAVFGELHIALAIAAVLYLIVGMVRLTFRFFSGTVKSYQDYDKPEDF